VKDIDILSLLSDDRKFSKGQKLISRFIINNYDKAAFMTAGRLAAEVGISESTVVRFASELGFKGYPEMRKAIQDMIRNRLTSVERIEVAKRMIDEREILKSVLSSDVENLHTTLNEIDQEKFDLVVNRILSSENVYIVGMRTSTSLSSFLGSYLKLIRKNVFVVQDTMASEVFEQLIRIGKNDLFIGISFPRYSKHTVDAMTFSKSRGAYTVAITDGKHSPCYDVADICLFAKSDMVSFLDSLVAPMSLINALIVAVGSRSPDNSLETFKQLEHIWEEYDVYETYPR
jgi:DNA-binding MurR/RpiR family transcriptional regulator